MHLKTFCFIYLCLGVVFGISQSIESTRVQFLQNEIRQSVKMDFSNFRLYPFAINNRQKFVLNFQSNQHVKGQVKVNWIDNSNNQLTFPTFENEQYVKMTIIDTKLNKTIQSRKFHFQSGLNFKAEAGRRYDLIFDDFGTKNKMIELAISKIEPSKLPQLSANNATNQVVQAMRIARQVRQQLNILTSQTQISQVSIKGAYELIMKSLSKYLVFSLWEICLVCMMMGCQIYMFNRLIKTNWTFI